MLCQEGCIGIINTTEGHNLHGRAGAIPQIRLAEMYLTRALLRFESGNAQGAADDLNAVRRRAWDERSRR